MADPQASSGGHAPPRRIAVVAVHGVADQQPADTARRISRLLTGLEVNGRFVYQPPTEVPIAIGVTEPGHKLSAAQAAETTAVMSFIQPTVRNAITDVGGVETEPVATSPAGAERLAHEVLKAQLDNTELPVEDRVWETLRIETTRRGGGERRDAHVYEMYWADLSRLGHKLLSPLLGLYQLLFFLPVLGSRTLAFARACMAPSVRKGLAWRLWAYSNAVATRALAWGVPILTLLLVSLLAVVLVVRILDGLGFLGYVPWALAVVLFVAVLYKGRLKIGGLPWPALILIPLLFGLVALATGSVSATQNNFPLATLSLWLTAAVGVLWLLRRYDARLPGAFAFGFAASASLSGFLYVAIYETTTVEGMTIAATDTAQWIVRWCYWGLWLLFSLSFLLNMIFGWLATRQVEDKKRARRARWTVDLSLALTAPVILLTNLALWSCLLWACEQFLTPPKTGSASFLQEVLDRSVIHRWNDVLQSAIPPLFREVWLSILLLALLLTLWSIWPAIRADARRRKGKSNGAQESIWSGRSLSQGFVAARVAGELIRWVLVVVALPASALCYLQFRAQTPGWLPEEFLTAPSGLLLFLAAGFATAVLGRGPLAFLAFGFRAALDVAFDVVNWLRSDPPTQTPSGRILSRFFSLLRHLETWRHPIDGGGYDAIVFIAHSQGAMIVAEALRYRQVEESSGNHRPGIHLLTMGAPLLQLYGLRFPFRYGWTWNDAQPWQASTANAPAALGVQRWWNVYHSGDYVGRFLWHGAAVACSDRPYDPEIDLPGSVSITDRRECCLGAGSHNTYWDGHSPGVVKLLDELINMA